MFLLAGGGTKICPICVVGFGWALDLSSVAMGKESIGGGVVSTLTEGVATGPCGTTTQV